MVSIEGLKVGLWDSILLNKLPNQKQVHPPQILWGERKSTAISTEGQHMALNKSYTEQSKSKQKINQTYIYTKEPKKHLFSLYLQITMSTPEESKSWKQLICFLK